MPFRAFVPVPLPPEPPIVWSAALRRRFDAALVVLGRLDGGLPLCARLLCEMHKVLLTHPGGRGKTPGEVRRTQVWIGGTRPGNAVFVPPPADAVPDGLGALERFLNDEPEPVPPLLKAALVHWERWLDERDAGRVDAECVARAGQYGSRPDCRARARGGVGVGGTPGASANRSPTRPRWSPPRGSRRPRSTSRW